MPQKYIKRKTKPVATYGETGEENKIQWITKSVGTFTGGGGGETGTVDTEMSDTSTNAVQNKVIKEYVDTADENLTKVMPTDIAVKDNNKIILQHDGEELTGQTNPVEFRTINGQSVLGEGNLSINVPHSVIIEPDMELTNVLRISLENATQIWYKIDMGDHETYEDIVLYPCSIEEIKDKYLVLKVQVDTKDLSDGNYIGLNVRFNGEFSYTFDITKTDNKIPSLFENDRIAISSGWDITAHSCKIIYTNIITQVDLELIAASGYVDYPLVNNLIDGHADVDYMTLNNDGSIANVTLIQNLGVDTILGDGFVQVVLETGKTFTECLDNKVQILYLRERNLKTLNGQSLVKTNAGVEENITIPTVQIEILEEGDN